MRYAIADADEVEGRFKRIRRALGVSAFGINQVELPPGWDGYPEHDEVEKGHEEVFLCLRGAGSLVVDGDDVPLRPGRYVFVTPEARRKLLPGDEGMSVLVIGGPPADTGLI